MTDAGTERRGGPRVPAARPALGPRQHEPVRDARRGRRGRARAVPHQLARAGPRAARPGAVPGRARGAAVHWLEARGRSAALALALTVGIVRGRRGGWSCWRSSRRARWRTALGGVRGRARGALSGRRPTPRPATSWRRSSGASSRRKSSSAILRGVSAIVARGRQTLVFAVDRRGAAAARRPAAVAPGGRRARQREPGLPRGAGDRPGRGHVLRGPDPGQRGDRRERCSS